MFGLFNRKKKQVDPPEAKPTPAITITTDVTYETSGEVQVAGTTTFALDAVDRLITRHSTAERDTLELPATITPEPDNPVDAAAIAVVVEGEKVGALPSFVSHNMKLRTGTAQSVRYQLHFLRQGGKKTKAKAFVWLSETSPQWTYTRNNPAPLLTIEQATENHARHVEISARNLAPETPLGRALRSGNLTGYTPLELIEPIKQLKREKRWEEALTLLYAAIEKEEAAHKLESRQMPAPWFTEHAAIVHRRLKQHDEEVAVLKRYLALLAPEQRETSKIQDRLNKIEGIE